jgi:hypothetical protein
VIGSQLVANHRSVAMGLGGHENSGVTATGKSGCQFHTLLVPAFKCSSVADMRVDPVSVQPDLIHVDFKGWVHAHSLHV